MLGVRKAILVAVLLLLSTGAIYGLFLSPFAAFNRAGLWGSNGRIGEGERFGLSIGQSYQSAAARMSALGFEARPITKENSCHGHDYDRNRQLALWWDDSWRKGTICIVVLNGEVEYVSWMYGVGFP
jgi:hypothetical protein